MSKTESYTHILKYTGLFGGVQVLGILVNIVRNKLVALILGPGGMGLVSLFNSSVKFISDSTNFGISMSAVKEISEHYDNADSRCLNHAIAVVRYWSLLTALFGMAVCMALSPLLSQFTFSWNGHTLHFILLSPIVALTAITLGEMAILKGTRQLRHLASVSVYNMLAALFISVPIYYFFGIPGIVPTLVLLALAQMLITIGCSFRLYPYKWNLSRELFSSGRGMIRLGTAFVLAGILGSGADFVIRSYLNNASGIATVGLFTAGYTMTMTYVGTVFSAMETDYFPRLSGVNKFGVTFTTMVNRQIEVMVLLVAPMLVLLMMFLPVLIPLLYSSKFVAAEGMMQIIIIAMYFRALKLPVEYIPLAKGDSKAYLFLEAVYDVSVVVCVIIGYGCFGLTGAGIGIATASFIGLIIDFIFARCRYGFRPSANVLLYTALQLPIGIVAYIVTLGPTNIVYWIALSILFIISMVASVIILRSKTHLWEKIKTNVKNKLHIR